MMSHEELEAEHAKLQAANEAATSWGAAVGARHERMKQIEGILRHGPQKEAHELVPFLAIHAVRYQEEFKLDGLHPTHYDLMVKHGARMDSFKRRWCLRQTEVTMPKHIFLLPCPFCGLPAKMFYGTGYVTAGCDHEECGVNPSVDAKNSGENVAESVAEIWNKRGPSE